ncbi:MAG TPA: J domain-containing protein [Chloroflexota bacterium]|nr:J domain-containing protein [Chloroflexota bacterium]
MAADSSQNANQNHYDVLGIDRRASSDDVRSAYRLRSHMFHPDKYENYPEPLRSQLIAEAAKEFKKLTTAYDTLRDPRKRTLHDRHLDSTWGRPASSRAAAGARPATRPASTRSSSKRSGPRATVREAAEADADDEKKARREAQREERARRAAAEAARPRERDPMLVVRPDTLEFGAMAIGATKQLPVKIANAGGRTLFGEISSNRAWLSVNRRSFVSSSVLILVTVDTNGLRAGEEYTGALTVTTLNGGDQIVPVSVRVSGKPEPLLAGVPSLLDFGTAEAGSAKTRTIRLTNAGTGTLIGSITTRVGAPRAAANDAPPEATRGAEAAPDAPDAEPPVEWLEVSESRFRANDFSFEVIARTAGLAPGDHEAEVLVYTNGGQARVKVLLQVTTPAGTLARGARRPEPDSAAAEGAQHATTNGAQAPSSPGATGAAGTVADLSKAERDQLLRRIVQIEPETVWERDFLRRIVHLIRSGTTLAPGELAKIYEMEARLPASAQEESKTT